VEVDSGLLDDSNDMDGCDRWEMVLRWSTEDDLDLNAMIFDPNISLIDVAYFGDREKIDGKL